MFRSLMFFVLTVLASCATVAVSPLEKSDFQQYDIPETIVLVAADRSADTQQKVGELSEAFARAGFTVLDPGEADKRLSAQGVSLNGLLRNEDYSLVGKLAAVDAVVLVREFYGTQVNFIDTKTAATRASGCWQTSYIIVVNEVVDQIKKKQPGTRVCPTRIE